uniref:Protein MEMO1 n=1 Tax=Syphacia muris TaxID=451379 RepID=A0A0N5AU17_9BILA
MSSVVRDSSHAGSWYSSNPKELSRQLAEWLSAADTPFDGPARAIISPHAGYTYSGATAAYAFKQIVPDNIETVFILGPSHVVCLNCCSLSTCSRYRTPFGDLIIDQEINNELLRSGKFDLMDPESEEAEHSLEMQLPFLYKVMEKKVPGTGYKIVPILVGSLSKKQQDDYGQILSRYIVDPKVLFVISSDFCHWGNRFGFSPYNQLLNKPVYEQIADLDQEGMEAISSLNPNVFNDYLKTTQNTICGRNPICVLLQAVEHSRQKQSKEISAELRFIKYAQSNQCRSTNDSSVSYAAGVLYISSTH